MGLVIGRSWIGVMLLAAYAMLAVVGYLVTAQWLGTAALQLSKSQAHPVAAMVLGVAILTLIGVIPLVGGVVIFVATTFGIGAVVVTAWRAYRGAPVVAASPARALTASLQAAA